MAIEETIYKDIQSVLEKVEREHNILIDSIMVDWLNVSSIDESKNLVAKMWISTCSDLRWRDYGDE